MRGSSQNMNAKQGTVSKSIHERRYSSKAKQKGRGPSLDMVDTNGGQQKEAASLLQRAWRRWKNHQSLGLSNGSSHASGVEKPLDITTSSEFLEIDNGLILIELSTPIAWKKKHEESNKLASDKRKIKEEIKSLKRHSIADMTAYGANIVSQKRVTLLGRRTIQLDSRLPSGGMFLAGQTTSKRLRKNRKDLVKNKLVPRCWIHISGREFSVRSGPHFKRSREMTASALSLYEMETLDIFYSKYPIAHAFSRMVPLSNGSNESNHLSNKIKRRIKHHLSKESLYKKSAKSVETHRSESSNADKEPKFVNFREDLNSGLCGIPRRLVFVTLYPLNSFSNKSTPCACVIFIFKLRSSYEEKLKQLQQTLFKSSSSGGSSGLNSGYGKTYQMDVSHIESRIERQMLDQKHGLPRSIDLLLAFLCCGVRINEGSLQLCAKRR